MAKMSAFAIIQNSDLEVLVCHRRDKDLWNLPGGAVETGESPWDAVVREVLEEVGLQVSISSLLGIYHKPEQDEVSYSFLCKIEGGELTLTSEADDIKWFKPDLLPANTSERQVQRIHDKFSFNKLVLADQSDANMNRVIFEMSHACIVRKGAPS